MKEWLSALDLAGLPGMPETISGVIRKAKKEGWRSRARQGRGGGKEYHVSSLPDETRAALRREGLTNTNIYSEAGHESDRRAGLPNGAVRDGGVVSSQSRSGDDADMGAAGSCSVNSGTMPTRPEAISGHPRQVRAEADQVESDLLFEHLFGYEPAKDKKNRGGEARNAILSALEHYLSVYDAAFLGKIAHFRQRFCDAYNQQTLKLPGWIYADIKRISYQTIYRWEAQRAVGGVSALKRKSFEREKTMDANAEMAEFAKNLLLSFPHLNPKAIWKEVQQRYPEHCPSLPTMRRWIAEWISQHQGAFEYAVSPKDHRSRRQRAFGSYAVDHYNQRWELDSTLADIVWELKDEYGDFKRFALVNAIEVYSRLGKGIVCRTSNAEAIASLLRECLLDWGVPESVKTDNGKDYTSRHIVNILSNLGIRHLTCKPYCPTEKPFIERLNKTQNHSSEFMMHGRYLGHNVIAQEKIRSREFFKSKPKKKGVPDEELQLIRLNLSLQEFQAFLNQWFEGYNNRPHEGLPKFRDAQGVLRHMTPNERAAGQQRREIQDVRALDVLMMPAATNHGYRSAVGKDGIRVGNLPNGNKAFYWHDCLVDVAERFEKVFVRLDPNPAYVHIFDSEDCTEYLGRLECYQISGNDPLPGIARTRAAEKEQRRLVSAGRMAAKRMERERNRLQPAREGAGNIALLPGQVRTHTTPALEAAASVVPVSMPAHTDEPCIVIGRWCREWLKGKELSADQIAQILHWHKFAPHEYSSGTSYLETKEARQGWEEMLGLREVRAM